MAAVHRDHSVDLAALMTSADRDTARLRVAVRAAAVRAVTARASHIGLPGARARLLPVRRELQRARRA